MIKERDDRDSHREHTPLIKVPEAIEIDTTSLTIEEQVGMMVKLIKEKTSQ